MFSYDAYATMLGIEPKIPLTPTEMADRLNVTFFPYDESVQSDNVKSFVADFKLVLSELKVNVIPFEQSLQYVSSMKVAKRFAYIVMNNALYSLSKICGFETSRIYVHSSVLANLLIRKRIKPGIVIVAVGADDSKLPIDYTSSFTRTLVTTILDKPNHISRESSFFDHFDTAMSLFARHMTNVVIAVDAQHWTLYNFNASHPTFSRFESLKDNLLHAFISKAAAPMRPERLSAFQIKKNSFDTSQPMYRKALEDLVDGGALLERVGLFPKGKKIDDLPFKNDYYRWIGKIHLDQRSGMSYGFLAWQLPTVPPEVLKMKDAPREMQEEFRNNSVITHSDGSMYTSCVVDGEDAVYLKVPEVRVLTLRSGCDKTNIIPEKDLLLMGISAGRMFLETPIGMVMTSDYRPSFDTKVILAHALGNVIAAALLNYKRGSNNFTKQLVSDGIAICHWHGYIDQSGVPTGWHVHGVRNPHVACSTPQSALYAIEGKLASLKKALKEGVDFLGDVHIEPHHGTNINFPSLLKLGEYFSTKQDIVSLGNKFHPS